MQQTLHIESKKPLKTPQFDHEKLEVFQASLDFIVLIEEITKHFPEGRAYLTDQIRRAGSSISLNIAEGAGEFSRSEKNRFYRIAKRSATECAGILEICNRLSIIKEKPYSEGRELLLRIVSMLVMMVKITNQIGQ
jgi:four helix bundle protein